MNTLRSSSAAWGRRRPLRRLLVAALLSLAAVGLVSLAIAALEPLAPVLSLGVLYLFAVLPVAAVWGLPFAIPVSIVSMLAFNWLFLPPTHTLQLADSENWVALAVYLLTAIIVSGLSARARRRAAEAEQRRREAILAVDVSALLLEGYEVEPRLATIASRTGRLLGVGHLRIDLDGATTAGPGEVAYDLLAGERVVGKVFLAADADPDPDVLARVLSSIASLLATAVERQALAEEARESEARRQREALEAEALRRSDAVKTAVLRSVSHDLRSPITAITTSAEVLGDHGHALGDAERRELVASIVAQIRRLDRLVGNLLELSRLEAGAAVPELELWTIDGLVARVLDAVGRENERIVVELPPDTPSVRVDPTHIERALVNLIENALKFSPVDADVVLRATIAEGEAELRVIDRGPGIPVHERERVFDAFVRGEGLDGERGSGLGLAIARGFVHLNGGRLWMESAPGGGSAFVVALPTVALPVGARR